MRNLIKTKAIKMSLPSCVTTGNLFCGFLSVFYTIDGRLVLAAWLIILAGFMDALDGKVARLAHAPSRFGVEFDSLADLCSFGAAPAILMFHYNLYFLGAWGMMMGFLFLLCGAIRLARFNVRLTGFDKEVFSGLPIPAAAGTLASYVVFSQNVLESLNIISLSAPLVVMLSILMVSALEYDTLPKFAPHSAWNRCKLGFFLLAVFLVIFFTDKVFFPLSVVYVMSGLIRWFLHLVSDREVAGVMR